MFSLYRSCRMGEISPKTQSIDFKRKNTIYKHQSIDSTTSLVRSSRLSTLCARIDASTRVRPRHRSSREGESKRRGPTRGLAQTPDLDSSSTAMLDTQFHSQLTSPALVELVEDSREHHPHEGRASFGATERRIGFPQGANSPIARLRSGRRTPLIIRSTPARISVFLFSSSIRSRAVPQPWSQGENGLTAVFSRIAHVPGSCA